jgi:hypothetical protein
MLRGLFENEMVATMGTWESLVFPLESPGHIVAVKHSSTQSLISRYRINLFLHGFTHVRCEKLFLLHRKQSGIPNSPADGFICKPPYLIGANLAQAAIAAESQGQPVSGNIR